MGNGVAKLLRRGLPVVSDVEAEVYGVSRLIPTMSTFRGV